jgi:hypothetical protein
MKGRRRLECQGHRPSIVPAEGCRADHYVLDAPRRHRRSRRPRRDPGTAHEQRRPGCARSRQERTCRAWSRPARHDHFEPASRQSPTASRKPPVPVRVRHQRRAVRGARRTSNANPHRLCIARCAAEGLPANRNVHARCAPASGPAAAVSRERGTRPRRFPSPRWMRPRTVPTTGSAAAPPTVPRRVRSRMRTRQPRVARPSWWRNA